MTTQNWINENWIVIAVAVAIFVALLLWLMLRRKGDSAVTLDESETPALEQEKTLDQGRDELIIEKQPEAKANPIAAMPAPTAAAAEPAAEGKLNIAAAVGEPDDLTKIKGLGPKLSTLLGTLGITRYDQIAAWSEADIVEVDGYLGKFAGRITRDNWVDQAGFLAKDDIAGFEAKYGKV
ncbi:hypothetical protein [Alterisphingorhabdus coralli]|uniref:Uncharacterized protein n=1 Tax=Alterisphingorhabdus coralli TaxID=3071408 RepID=A0AA97I1X0_9SPHN|nr:hypothetical protein [Parasphingorhabdus sp. SCSIO 66989]WOE75738.1 hypothetical protein RB602_03225 [Parasphingorhabdus sp. SCSIO 66989]